MVAEIPKTLATDKKEIFHYVKDSIGACPRARKIAQGIRDKGFKARVKDLHIKKKLQCLVYKGPKRKTQWTGYGKAEKGGLGRGK